MSASPGAYPPPVPLRVEVDVAATEWIDRQLHPGPHLPPIVGYTVPSGYEAYARVLHPARRFLGPGVDQRVHLRWSEIAQARRKTMHPEVGLHALIDNRDWYDDEHWKRISTGEGEWFPPYEWLEENEALALVSLLRPFTTSDDAWFMLWDGYGDLGPAIDRLPRGTIHRSPEPPDVPPELRGGSFAFRHYLVFRGPLDAVSTWYDWRTEGPNYLWPDDRGWILCTEIDGFSTYVGAPKDGIDRVLASPLIEAVASDLTHTFDGIADRINESRSN